MKVAFVGDLEGNLSRIYQFQKKHSDLDFVVQVGDFGLFRSYEAVKQNKKYKGDNKKLNQLKTNLARFNLGYLPKFPYNTLVIKGNNEDLDLLEDIQSYPRPFETTYRLSLLRSGFCTHISSGGDGFIAAVVGGIYSPTKSKSGDKSSSFTGGDRRFFTKGDVNNVKASFRPAKGEPCIVITHQAPSGVLPKQEEGSKILSSMFELDPDYWIHGHHHYNYKTTVGTTTVIGLGNMDKNPNSFEILEF